MPKVSFVPMIASVCIVTYIDKLTLVCTIIAHEANECIGHRRTSLYPLGSDLRCALYEITDLYKSLEISEQTHPSAGIQEFMVQIVREKNVSWNLL